MLPKDVPQQNESVNQGNGRHGIQEQGIQLRREEKEIPRVTAVATDPDGDETESCGMHVSEREKEVFDCIGLG